MTQKKKRGKPGHVFYVPNDYPEKAIKYAAFVEQNAARLPKFSGTDVKTLHKIKKDAEQLRPVALEIAKLETQLSELKTTYHDKGAGAWDDYMEQLENARTHAKRQKLQWLADELEEFKAHESRGRPAKAGGSSAVTSGSGKPSP